MYVCIAAGGMIVAWRDVIRHVWSASDVSPPEPVKAVSQTRQVEKQPGVSQMICIM